MTRRSLTALRRSQDGLQAEIDHSRAVMNRIDDDWAHHVRLPELPRSVRLDTVRHLRRLHEKMAWVRASLFAGDQCLTLVFSCPS